MCSNSTFLSSRIIQAPELLRQESSNTAASDVYSFGIMIYEMFSRKDPYEGEEFEKVIRNVCDKDINLRPPIPPSMPQEVATLLYSTALVPDQSARPTFQELDGFLKRFQAQNVEPDGPQIESLQMTKARDNQTDNSSRLLEEIFPPHVAAALREGRKVEPENFDMVTIFFSDIKGFTTLSADMSPEKVSDMLDRLYNKFDDLSHKHGVFKLETIGDAWMGVANLFEACPDDHVKRIALFSIDGEPSCDRLFLYSMAIHHWMDNVYHLFPFLAPTQYFHSSFLFTTVLNQPSMPQMKPLLITTTCQKVLLKSELGSIAGLSWPM